MNPLFVLVFSFLTKYVFKVAATEEEGGRRLSFMIASPSLNGVSGGYYSGKPGKEEFSPIAASAEAMSEKSGSLIFELTKKLVAKK